MLGGFHACMECYCYLQNIQGLLSDGPNTLRTSIRRNILKYQPISAKDLSRLHQFGTKVLPGVFLGCVFHAADLEKGDIVVAHIEELEKMDKPEIHAGRLNDKEVFNAPKKVNISYFPIADGTVKHSGGEQVLRTATLIRDNPDRGEEQENLLGDQTGLHQHLFQDSSPDDGEARNDFWSVHFRKLHLPLSR